MKKFKFTLQTVHNVREMKQEAEQLVLSKLQNEAEQIAEQIERIEAEYIRAIENYSKKLENGKTLNIREMEFDAMQISELDKLKRRTNVILEEKKQACAAQSAKLAAAAREVKITDRLRENQALRHRLETAKNEQNALDEIVSANFARKLTTKL